MKRLICAAVQPAFSASRMARGWCLAFTSKRCLRSLRSATRRASVATTEPFFVNSPDLFQDGLCYCIVIMCWCLHTQTLRSPRET